MLILLSTILRRNSNSTDELSFGMHKAFWSNRMTELKRGSGEVSATVEEQTTVRASSNQADARGGALAGIDADTYDELDYRLMATFPASDAVARY